MVYCSFEAQVYLLSVGFMFFFLKKLLLFQIRRSLLNEDEYGFRRAKQPIYYDEGLEVITFYSFIMHLFCLLDNLYRSLTLDALPFSGKAED
jgi:hypothetical protein